MIARLLNGRHVEVYEDRCAFRPCLWVGEWKGILTQGKGYRYAPREQWHLHCHRRAEFGCPFPLPDPDPDKARCCLAPAVRHDPSRKRQKCRNCGTWLTGFALEVARAQSNSQGILGS